MDYMITDDVKNRFWSKVKAVAANDCWDWTACLHYKGYGEMAIGNGRKTKAHRIAWIIANGSIDNEMSVSQTCGNRKCCNPQHLSISKNRNESDKWPQSFWGKINIRGIDECWPWTAKSRTEFGYGVVRLPWTKETGRGRMTSAHRVAYELKVGPIPNGLSILHKCDNPSCCNPNHLFPGTQQDNIDDCIKKGRKRICVGTKNKNAKITEQIVSQCRKEYVPYSRQFGTKGLARKYGISPSNILNIIKRIAWRHVP